MIKYEIIIDKQLITSINYLYFVKKFNKIIPINNNIL
jgi:hypothetical protein